MLVLLDVPTKPPLWLEMAVMSARTVQSLRTALFVRPATPAV